MVHIEVTGPNHSGKGHVIAAIAHLLREMGAEVAVQGENTHNAEKISMSDNELKKKIAQLKISITELRTFR